LKDLRVNEELYLSEISITRDQEIKSNKNRNTIDNYKNTIDSTQYITQPKTKIAVIEEFITKSKEREPSPRALNLPQLYEDVSKNNRLMKIHSKSQRDLNFNFKQFWPVSKNFKISNKSKIDQEKIQATPIQNDLTIIDENTKPFSAEKKRPITGASSNVNKYEIDFEEYKNYCANVDKNKTLVHLYEHNTNFEYNKTGKKNVLPLIMQN